MEQRSQHTFIFESHDVLSPIPFLQRFTQANFDWSCFESTLHLYKLPSDTYLVVTHKCCGWRTGCFTSAHHWTVTMAHNPHTTMYLYTTPSHSMTGRCIVHTLSKNICKWLSFYFQFYVIEMKRVVTVCNKLFRGPPPENYGLKRQLPLKNFCSVECSPSP